MFLFDVLQYQTTLVELVLRIGLWENISANGNFNFIFPLTEMTTLLKI